jgi:hypothetical protein
MRRVAALIAVAALLLVPVTALAQEQLTAELSHEVEVPAPTLPSGYAGSGNASATISEDGSEITYEVSFEGLTGPLTMAHIHLGAPGNTGPPIFWLTEMGVEGASSPLSGTLTAADFMAVDGLATYEEALDEMRAGNTYVNLHTPDNAPGELRGQLTGGTSGEPLPDSATAVQPVAPAPTIAALAAFVFLGLMLLVGRRFMARLG